MYKDFKLSNLYAAAFLLANGLELTGIEKISPKKANFTFKSATRVATLLNEYNYSLPNSTECLLDARTFVTAIKSLKERLYTVIQAQP